MPTQLLIFVDNGGQRFWVWIGDKQSTFFFKLNFGIQLCTGKLYYIENVTHQQSSTSGYLILEFIDQNADSRKLLQLGYSEELLLTIMLGKLLVKRS